MIFGEISIYPATGTSLAIRTKLPIFFGRRKRKEELEQTMTSPQQAKGFFGLGNESVMTRALDGTINFWNDCAEDFYGWKQDEAIGKVSHSLLQTQFPKPLEEIDSELVRNGRWEGKLVHTTREGRRVVVDSRWVLKENKPPGAVVEINSRSTDDEMHPHAIDAEGGDARRQEPTFRLTRISTVFSNTALLISAYVLFVCVAILWIFYGWFGHELIKTIYESGGTWPLDTIMRQRAVIPLQSYYHAADYLLVLVTFRVVAFLLVLAALTILLRKPSGALLACFSFFLCSFTLFSLVELYPALIRPFHLTSLRYYAWKDCCVPDDTLGSRYKPFFSAEILFRGYLYSPEYGVEEPQVTVKWTTDKNGFVNNSAARDVSDIVIIGDSFVAAGLDEADTFGRRVEKISGLTVANLGVPGWGPFQYLEALKKYGVQQKPKYALFVFYAGNDIDDMREYLGWKKGEHRNDYDASFLSQPFLRRYVTVLKDGADLLGSVGDTIFSMTLGMLKNSHISAASIHPDLAVVNIGQNTYKMLIPPENKISSSAELLASQYGEALKEILSEFKNLSVDSGIVPIIVYIPTITTIYAEHSSDQSGKNWLRWRKEQIDRKRNTENAVAVLARSLNIQLVNLSPAFESAAKQGKLLYHRFDTHWNSEGRQVAALYVAAALKRQP